MRRLLALLSIFAFTCTVVMGQQFEISGVVTGADVDMPLPGATVTLKGTTQGTVTNTDGEFTLSASSGDILVVSFVGYLPREIPIENQTEFDIVLEPDIGELEEVVVVGYGVEKKSLVTGAIAKVNNEDIEKSNTLRVEQALQGKTAGVSITQTSGQPGSGFTIRVRGTGSNGNSEPVFIVDGLRMGGIESINVNDIESVEVLKDAASAAIYGAEGANGVVLITTKSGSAGEPTFTYKYNYGIQDVANKQFDVMSSHDYLDYRWRALLAEGSDSSTINNDLPLPGEETYSTDWLDEVINTAPMHEHFLSYSGGNEKSQYNASGSYLDQDGIGGGEKANFRRITARFSGNHNIKEWLKVGHKLNYSHSEDRSLPENSSFNSYMNMSILMDPLTPTTVPYDSMYYIGEDFRPLLVSDGQGNYYGVSRQLSGEIYNPLALLELQNGKSNTDKLFGSLFADIIPFKGLSFRTKFDFDLAYVNYDGWNPAYYLNAEQVDETSGVYRGYSKYQTYQWGNFANYEFDLGDHNFKLLAGMEANVYQNINLSASGSNLVKESENFAYVGTTPDSTHIAGDGFNEVRRESYIGRISYNFREKYMATINYRTDKSSLFGPNYRAGNFPSASAGWIISREDFFNFDPISFLKIRASWGQNGSTSNLGSFSYLSLITSVYQYTNSANSLERGSEPSQIANPNLRWEVSEQTDIGFDLGLFDNRLFFSADYYNKLTKNLITQSTYPVLYGNYNSAVNAGNIVNRGVEFELNWQQNLGEFNYDLGLNAAYNYNEVTNTGDQELLTGITVHTDDDYLTFFEAGYPAWYFSAYKTDGIFQTEQEIDNYVGLDGETKIQRNAQPGDVKFVDVNQDGIIDPKDRVMVGDPYPDWVLGANLFAEYKGFDLTVYIQANTGLSVVNALNRSDKVGMNRPQFYYDMAWDGEGSTNEWFRPTEIDPNGNFRMSDLLVEDADFLRVKTLQLGYTFGEIGFFNDFGLKEARIYVSGTNLFTLTNYKGLEPEIGAVAGPAAIGVDYGFYPSARIYQFGFKVTF